MTATDIDARYPPDSMMTLRHGLQRVVSTTAHPPGHKSIIRPDLTAVEFTLADGTVRWWGCDRAYIDGTLRMVMVGGHECEERQKWRKVQP